MRSASRSPHPRHLLAGLASAGLVLVLHGWLLAGLPRAAAPGHAATAVLPRAVQVRQIESAATPTPAAPTAQAVLPATPSPHPLPRRQPVQPTAATVLAPPASTAIAEAEFDAAPQPIEAPVYATRLPPAATLHYSLRRGTASGQAVLRWSPEGGRYGLSLHAHLAKPPKVTWASQGTIDAHGIAPERYTESRGGRELRAANFQRDSGRITFSGPPLEHQLPPGAQDRLSWMLQLGAVLAADRTLEAPGQNVLLFVVGSRGDAEVWTFTVQGRADIDLPGAGKVDSVLLRREPRRTYDTLVEAWLDPARHHLPVRAHLTLRGDTTQFVLEQLTLP